MNKLVLIPLNTYYLDVLEYIYNSDNDIDDFIYHGEITHEYYSYNKKQNSKSKILIPGYVQGHINYKDTIIEYEHKIIKDNKNTIKTLFISDGCGGTDTILSELIIKNENKGILIELCEEAKKIGNNKRETNKEKSNETIRIYYYNEYWQLLSKRPKRPLETIYLKKGIKEDLQNNISTFFNI